MRPVFILCLSLAAVLSLTQCAPLMLAPHLMKLAQPALKLPGGKSMLPSQATQTSSASQTAWSPPSSADLELAPPANMQLSTWEQKGLASYYAEERQGTKTVSGEVIDVRCWTASHPTLPLGTLVRVTNLRTGRYADMRINNRCRHSQRVIDVAKVAAYHLEMIGPGVVPVSIRAWEPNGWGW